MEQRISKVVFITTAMLVIVLFGSAFVLSYEALRQLALDNGIRHGLGWLWPLGLDAFMAVASLYMLWAHMNREWEVLPLMLIMVVMGASVVFNIVNAPDNSLARSVAALPPLVAFMAFEVFIIMVRHYTDMNMNDHVGTRDEHVNLGWSTVDERRDLLRDILASNGREWTQDELADELGVSRTTIKRDREAIGA